MVNLRAEIISICATLGVRPEMVRSILLEASPEPRLTVTKFKPDADGSKYVDPETNEPAVERETILMEWT